MRAIVAGLVSVGLAACAGSKDMSRSSDDAAPAATRGAAEATGEHEGDGADVTPSPPHEAGAPDSGAGVTSPRESPTSGGREASEEAARPVVEPPAIAPAELLGRPRAEVEARVGRLQPDRDGWARQGELELRLRGGRCVAIRGHVPEDMDCAGAAVWLGYGATAYPLRRAESCEWPGLSLKHRLAEGVAGRYVPATRLFEVWLHE